MTMTQKKGEKNQTWGCYLTTPGWSDLNGPLYKPVSPEHGHMPGHIVSTIKAKVRISLLRVDSLNKKNTAGGAGQYAGGQRLTRSVGLIPPYGEGDLARNEGTKQVLEKRNKTSLGSKERNPPYKKPRGVKPSGARNSGRKGKLGRREGGLHHTKRPRASRRKGWGQKCPGETLLALEKKNIRHVPLTTAGPLGNLPPATAKAGKRGAGCPVHLTLG